MSLTSSRSVPLSILSSTGSDSTSVLDKREGIFEVDTSKPWKLNGGTMGVCRVLYTPERLQMIATQASAPDSPFYLDDRIGLVHDAMALAKSGHLKVSAVLALMEAWASETEYLVWEGISDNFNILVATWWEDQRIQTQLRAFRRSLYGSIARNLGIEYGKSDGPDVSQLRTITVGGAAAGGDELVLTELKTKFARYIAGEEDAIPSDLLDTTFTQAIKHGGKDEYDAVLEIYEAGRGPGGHIAAIRALGATEDSALFERTLTLIRTKSRNQDVVHFFAGLNANHKARRRVRDYFEQEYETLSERFKGTSAMRHFVTSTYSGYSTQEDLEHVRDFFKEKDTAWYSMALAQAIDSIKARIRWIERSTGDVRNYLDGRDVSVV
ncbi:unnamed protein product [Peniophora sp. CBMAI 1063]|nr:unnamed protein product [Peniophora sp. CBMAI 1063]